MAMREYIKELVPPVLVRAGRKLVGTGHRPTPERYDSWEHAKAACGAGYEEARLVEVVRRKTEAYRDALARQPPDLDFTLCRLLLALHMTQHASPCVLDFGGACGANFFASSALGRVIGAWLVVETPAMVREAKVLASDRLKFVDRLEDPGTCDLLIVSSSIQYTPDPLTTLRELLSVGAPYVYLTRTPLIEQSEPMVSVQEALLSENGPGPLPPGVADVKCRYPITYLPQGHVEKMLQEQYSIQLRFDEGTYHRSPSVSTFGYFAKRR
jgi:putative methyltransferase (TIGR04325 family)